MLSLLFNLGLRPLTKEKSLFSTRISRLALRLLRVIFQTCPAPREVYNALLSAMPKFVESCITSSSPKARSKSRKDINNARTTVRVLLKCAGTVLLPPNVSTVARRLNEDKGTVLSSAMRVFAKLRNEPRKVKPPALPPVPKEQEDAVMAMGFTTQQARVALRKVKNDTQQAVLWLLSNPIASSAYQQAASMYQDREEEKEEEVEEEKVEEIEEEKVEEKIEDNEYGFHFGRGLSIRAIASEVLMILRSLLLVSSDSVWYVVWSLSLSLSLIHTHIHTNRTRRKTKCILLSTQHRYSACRAEIEQAIFKCPSDVTTSLEPIRTHLDEMSRVSSALASLAVVGAGWDSLRLGGIARMRKSDGDDTTQCIVLSIQTHLERRNVQNTKSLVNRREYSARESGTVIAVFQGKSSSRSVSLSVTDVVPVEEVNPPIRNEKLVPVLIRLATRVMDVDSVAATSLIRDATCGEAASALALSTLRAFCARALQSALHDPEAARSALNSNVASLLLAVASQAAPEPQLISLGMIERRAQKISGFINDAMSSNIRLIDPPLPSLEQLKLLRKKEKATPEQERRRELAKDLLVYVRYSQTEEFSSLFSLCCVYQSLQYIMYIHDKTWKCRYRMR